MLEKLGIVIVTFNPSNDDNLNNKIESYKKVVSRIVVVDNNSSMPLPFDSDGQVFIIHNSINVGHAKALNIGCMYLYNEGYKYVLLLGQDSKIDNKSIVALANAIGCGDYGMVGPQIFGNDPLIKPTFLIRTKRWFKKQTVDENEIKDVYINITSGSTINLSVWREIGGFWDPLFIEKVDDEFALRMRKFGYRIGVVGSAKLIEPYGNSKTIKKIGLTFHPTFHKPERLYLLYRNKKFIRKEYFFSEFPFIVFQHLALAKRFLTILFVEDKKFKKIYNIIKGSLYGVFHRIKRKNTPYECDPMEYVKK